MMKNGAIELSVNLLVITIISILILGIGFFLLIKGSDAMNKAWINVRGLQESQIRDLIARNDGLVAAYPTALTVKQGENPIITIGISNQLGEDYNFCYFIEPEPGTCTDPDRCISLLFDGAGMKQYKVVTIKNTQIYFMPLMIMTKKAEMQKSYMINVQVFTADQSGFCITNANKYGDMQKIVVNVK
jgi:hypothetical protein